MGVLLITAEAAYKLAQELSPPIYEVGDAWENDTLAYITSATEDEADYEPCLDLPFDATLSAEVRWSFKDFNEKSHSLTITAKLEYTDFDNTYIISTSVSLNMYISGVAGTTRTEYATWWPHQRKTFYAVDRHWAFYSNNTHLLYTSSTNGINWTAPTVVKYGIHYGLVFSVWLDGQYVHYAYESIAYIYAWLMYRKGQLHSNGTITWITNEQTIASMDYTYASPVVSVDNNGYPWISYAWSKYGSTCYPCVTRSALNNGSWVTALGFPYQLSSISANWRAAIIPLTGGKMLAIYAREGDTVKSRRWTGSSWSTEKATTSAIGGGNPFLSAVNQGDDVHLVFLKYATYDIIYTKYSYTSDAWGTEVKVQNATTSSSAPVLSINRANNNLYCFWAGSPNASHIYYKKYSAGTWDTMPTDWIDESVETLTANDRLTCSYEAYGGKIGLLYMTKQWDYYIPFNVKYALL
jgi:hypothetical protein